MSKEESFADLMSKAVKLKSHQQATLRRIYDTWPTFYQHSMFMQDNVVSLRLKPFSERMSAALVMKEKGNAHYNRKTELEEAVAEYEKAIAIFKYCENKDVNWKKKGIEDKDIVTVDFQCSNVEEQSALDALKISCYLNIAICKYHLRDYLTCIQACSQTLEIDSQNVKALYRRAQALITPASSGALEFERAIKDLKQAFGINPSDDKVRKMLHELLEQKRRQKNLDQATFSGMFDRGTIYQDQGDSKPLDETEISKKKLESELCQAEALARLCDSKGQRKEAKAIRRKVAKAKFAQAQRCEAINFLDPTDEMIQDAKKNGIDLRDKQVQHMLHDLQQQEDATGSKDTTEKDNGDTINRRVESLLQNMSSSDIGQLLLGEGIPYQSITDRTQIMDIAREVLTRKLLKGNQGDSQPSKSYFKTVAIIAVCWSLLRFFSSGGFTVLLKLSSGGGQGRMARDMSQHEGRNEIAF